MLFDPIHFKIWSISLPHWTALSLDSGPNGWLLVACTKKLYFKALFRSYKLPIYPIPSTLGIELGIQIRSSLNEKFHFIYECQCTFRSSLLQRKSKLKELTYGKGLSPGANGKLCFKGNKRMQGLKTAGTTL